MGEIVDIGRLCERPIHAQIYLVAITPQRHLDIHRSQICLPAQNTITWAQLNLLFMQAWYSVK